MNLEIFDYGMNGEGVGKLSNKIFLVENSLVGEIVDAEILKDFKNYSTAKTTRIIKKSANRIEPKCPCFSTCGGCDLQHMKYCEQLNFKTLLVKKTLKKIANIDAEVSPCVASSCEFNYRNKMSFSYKENFGLFSTRSHNLIKVKSCPLASENINHILELTSNFFEQNKQHSNLIKNLVVREIDNQILVGIVACSKIDLSSYYEMIKSNFTNIGVYLIINKRKDSVVLDGKVEHIGGIKEIQTENFKVRYSLDLIGFQQTNIDIQNKIYNMILENINENSTVVNGFSGQGLLSAILSTKAKFVYGIEINENSHKSAENLKKFNKISNLINILGDFNKKIKEIKNFDTVILDPSKKGCGKIVMQNLRDINKIIYISCNPIALAKDLREIVSTHKIETIIPFDMFPQTNSVETLVVLKKNIDN